MFPSCEFLQRVWRRKGAFQGLHNQCIPVCSRLHSNRFLVALRGDILLSSPRAFTHSTWRPPFPSLPSDLSTNIPPPGSLFWPSGHLRARLVSFITVLPGPGTFPSKHLSKCLKVNLFLVVWLIPALPSMVSSMRAGTWSACLERVLRNCQLISNVIISLNL